MRGGGESSSFIFRGRSKSRPPWGRVLSAQRCGLCYKSEPPGNPLINKQLLFTVLEAGKSKIKLLIESECLVRAHFQFIDGSLLAVSSHGRDSERSLWDLLHRDSNPIH